MKNVYILTECVEHTEADEQCDDRKDILGVYESLYDAQEDMRKAAKKVDVNVGVDQMDCARMYIETRVNSDVTMNNSNGEQESMLVLLATWTWRIEPFEFKAKKEMFD